MKTFGETLKKLREGKELNQTAAAREIGFSSTTWNNYESGVSYPKLLDLVKLAKYFGVPEDQLIHGVVKDPSSGNLRETAENRQSYAHKFTLRSDHAIKHQLIPLYDLEATAGLAEIFGDNVTQDPIDTIHIPNLPRCDGAIFVTGNSMYPLLKSGDMVIYKEVNDIPSGIFWGQMYLISVSSNGDEFISVKFIHKSDLGKDHITLVSENKHYQDKDVHITTIRALALIKASVRVHTMF